MEKKSTAKLQDARTVRKIHKLDDHVCLAFAGLTADARVLVNRARTECQSYRLTLDEPARAPTHTPPLASPSLPSPPHPPFSPRPHHVPNTSTQVTVEYITRYIAGVQQKYTQSGGVRPFGIATLVVGFDPSGVPCLYQTDPSGTFSAWKANATGRNAKTVREWLEKNYAELSGAEAVKLCVRALLEVVESGSKNIEVAVMRRGTGLTILTDEEVDAVSAEIEADKSKAEEAKKVAAAAAAGGAA